MQKYFWILKEFSMEKLQVRDVTIGIFPQNILPEMLEINLKCHERLTLGQTFWLKPTTWPELNVSNHGLSPLH